MASWSSVLGSPARSGNVPFGDEVAVFRVGGQMFALVMLSGREGFVSLKCDPDLALELRARHPAVRPGYHADKRHWNSVDLDGSIDRLELCEMIEHSYDLVVAGLPQSSTRSASPTLMAGGGGGEERLHGLLRLGGAGRYPRAPGRDVLAGAVREPTEGARCTWPAS
jgi:predicted DNA-binding protein (MmcQ/YjbR family)